MLTPYLSPRPPYRPKCPVDAGGRRVYPPRVIPSTASLGWQKAWIRASDVCTELCSKAARVLVWLGWAPSAPMDVKKLL